jgi:hypothetical protein
MALKKPNTQEPKKEDPRRIKVYLCYGYPSIPEEVNYFELPERWDSWDEEKQRNFLHAEAMDALGNSYVEFGAYVVDKEGD